MIEGDEAVINHDHRIIEADLVAQALGKTLDQANHVVTEISDGSGNQRWQAGEPHGTKALDPLAEERDGIARYTFAGAHPEEIFRYGNGAGVLENRERLVWEERDPLSFLPDRVERFGPVGLPILPPPLAA